jgi:hypothetical protein
LEKEKEPKLKLTDLRDQMVAMKEKGDQEQEDRDSKKNNLRKVSFSATKVL